MVVLGIDPGIATVGFGAIEAKKGRCQVLRYGVISTPAGLTLSNRLSMIFRDMEELIHTFQPDEMAVEELLSHQPDHRYCCGSRARRHPVGGGTAGGAGF